VDVGWVNPWVGSGWVGSEKSKAGLGSVEMTIFISSTFYYSAMKARFNSLFDYEKTKTKTKRQRQVTLKYVCARVWLGLGGASSLVSGGR